MKSRAVPGLLARLFERANLTATAGRGGRVATARSPLFPERTAVAGPAFRRHFQKARELLENQMKMGSPKLRATKERAYYRLRAVRTKNKVRMFRPQSRFAPE